MDIAEDVKGATARETAIEMHMAAIKAAGHSPLWIVEVTALVEAAILAERERCAKIAEAHEEVAQSVEEVHAAQSIASAIRSGDR